VSIFRRRTVLVSGVDMIEISRVREVIERQGEQFLRRVFTESELRECRDRVESLAARFAAKEAVAKALGRGIGDVRWHDIEIGGNEYNAPQLVLHGKGRIVARQLGVRTWALSLSHTHDHAVAVVVGQG
jgi:holo-[acyl-carrier protein] synthase